MSQVLVWGHSGRPVVMPGTPKPEVVRPKMADAVTWDGERCFKRGGSYIGTVKATLPGGPFVWCAIDERGIASTGSKATEVEARASLIRSAIHRGILPKVGQ